MKAISFLKNGLFISLLISGLVFISSCDKDDDDDALRTYAITGNASGSQVVPAVAVGGTGTMTGTYNPNNRTLTYTTTWAGMTGAPTNGGFYYGASGTNGTAVGTPWTFPGGSTGTGTMSGSMTLTEAEATQLINGQWYYSYGTAANSSGEARGQMTAALQ